MQNKAGGWLVITLERILGIRTVRLNLIYSNTKLLLAWRMKRPQADFCICVILNNQVSACSLKDRRMIMMIIGANLHEF